LNKREGSEMLTVERTGSSFLDSAMAALATDLSSACASRLLPCCRTARGLLPRLRWLFPLPDVVIDQLGICHRTTSTQGIALPSWNLDVIISNLARWMTGLELRPMAG
jgi:hypothetical protein